jgi:hypothetical protein
VHPPGSSRPEARNKPAHLDQYPNLFGDVRNAPRCGAFARTTGKLCKSPAVRGKQRCRMHGGSRGSGAPKGNKNAEKSGRYSAKARAYGFLAGYLAWEVTGDDRHEIAALTNKREATELVKLLWEMGQAEVEDGGRDDLQRVAVSVAKQAGLRWVPPVGK